MIRFDILFFMGLVTVCGGPVSQRPDTTIEGEDGKPVILPCSTKDKMDISHDRIEWLFKDPTKGEDKDVHTYYQRKDQLYKQSDDFKGRTSLFKDKLSSGNCSLRLNGTTSHSGSYYCRVTGNLSCNLTLRVLPKGIDDSHHDPNNTHPEENNHDPLNPNVLQCPNTTIKGKDGDTVILPCSTKDKMDISHDQVEWLFEDPATGEDKTVHTCFNGEDILHQQSDDFKGRTSLFKEKLSSGNLSLSLLVTTSDSGSYQSRVGGYHCCTVTLKVLSKGEDDSSQKHQDVTESPENPDSTDRQNNIVGGAVGVLGVAALIIIIPLAYCYRERLMNFCSGMKPNNPQNYQEVPLQAQQPPENQEKNQWTKTQMTNGSR